MPVTVLFKNLNFTIEDGDFICFSGVSGSGKTTLLNIIESMDDGKLIIDGIEYKTNKHKLKFYQSKVGFLFQNSALMENKTVKQNLEIIKRENRSD